MAKLVKKSFHQPDELQTPDKTYTAVVKLGPVTAIKTIRKPGWKWSECIGSLVGREICHDSHVGTVVSGSLTVVCDDGEEITVSAGDAYSFAPGHDGWVVGDEDFVAFEFSALSPEPVNPGA